jgi:hypothetical protein
MVRAIQEELCWYVGLNYTTIYPTFYAEDFLACLSMMGPTLKVWSMLYNCKANYTEKFDMSQISVTWVKNLMYSVLGFAGLQIGFGSYKYTITWSFISKLGKYNKLFCVQRVHSPQIQLSCSCFATMCFVKSSSGWWCLPSRF